MNHQPFITQAILRTAASAREFAFARAAQLLTRQGLEASRRVRRERSRLLATGAPHGHRHHQRGRHHPPGVRCSGRG